MEFPGFKQIYSGFTCLIRITYMLMMIHAIIYLLQPDTLQTKLCESTISMNCNLSLSSVLTEKTPCNMSTFYNGVTNINIIYLSISQGTKIYENK